MRYAPPPDYDTWLLQGSGIDDDPCLQDVEFNMGLRGGIINVKASSAYEKDGDEDGCYTVLVINIDTVHWSFDEEFLVDDLTFAEEQEIKRRAETEMKSQI